MLSSSSTKKNGSGQPENFGSALKSQCSKSQKERKNPNLLQFVLEAIKFNPNLSFNPEILIKFDMLSSSSTKKNGSGQPENSGSALKSQRFKSSVCCEQKENPLAASFVQSPIGEKLDWRLSATMCPCHVTVLMESYHLFMDFVKRSNVVSPNVSLETATALQMKFQEVTRKAQAQFGGLRVIHASSVFKSLTRKAEQNGQVHSVEGTRIGKDHGNKLLGEQNEVHQLASRL